MSPDFKQAMKEKHVIATRVEHLKRTIGHCLSVVALCEIGGQEKAKASYEARLRDLTEELRIMLEEQKDLLGAAEDIK